MRLLVAPDSFKGTMSAQEVAEAIVAGARSAGIEAIPCPVADGGEGTLDILCTALGGDLYMHPASDPLGRPTDAAFALLDGGRAVVEMAQASGLGLLAEGERDAEAASTYGTGELIAAAAATGAKEILVTVGGSATTDGGIGAIEAVAAAGGLRGSQLQVLCDVTTPFERAAEVFAAQKGADRATVRRLTDGLHDLAENLPRDPRGKPMTGAGGGLAGGLWAAFGAKLVPGSDTVLDALQFDAHLREADLVVVGEGRLDAQSLDGKIIGAITRRSRTHRLSVHAVVGQSQLDAAQAAKLGLSSVTTAGAPAALAAAGRALAQTGSVPSPG